MPSAGVRRRGPIAGLAGGSSDGTSMAVGMSDTTAGHKSGTVAVNLTSIAVSGSGLSNTALSSQTLTVTGDVYDYAAPSVLLTTINFGSIHAGQSFAARKSYDCQHRGGRRSYRVAGRLVRYAVRGFCCDGLGCRLGRWRER